MTYFAGDRERLDRFRAGDRETLAEVYRAYVGAVARVLRSGFSIRNALGQAYVKGLDSAYDVECGCQEVFLRAFRPAARAAYDGERSFRNYLFRIARNWRIDEFRRRHPTVPVDVIEDVEDEAPPTDERLGDRQLAATLETWAAGLPEKDRRYFQARFQDGLSQTDAAARQGLTRIQGRRIEARLKTGLLEHLQAHGYGGEP